MIQIFSQRPTRAGNIHLRIIEMKAIPRANIVVYKFGFIVYGFQMYAKYDI